MVCASSKSTTTTTTTTTHKKSCKCRPSRNVLAHLVLKAAVAERSNDTATTYPRVHILRKGQQALMDHTHTHTHSASAEKAGRERIPAFPPSSLPVPLEYTQGGHVHEQQCFTNLNHATFIGAGHDESPTLRGLCNVEEDVGQMIEIAILIKLVGQAKDADELVHNRLAIAIPFIHPTDPGILHETQRRPRPQSYKWNGVDEEKEVRQQSKCVPFRQPYGGRDVQPPLCDA